MGKGKGKGKGRKSSSASAGKEKKEKGRKSSTKGGRKSSTKGGKKGGKKGGRKSSANPASRPTETITPVPPPPPEPWKPSCNEKIKMGDPCRYNEDACCKEAVLCRPNKYPGLLEAPQAMAVVGSECGSYESLCKLLRVGLRCADRVFAMTPWGNYVVLRSHNGNNKIYFLFDGCTCNVNRFRYMDLNVGTAGLLYFEHLHEVINYIIESRAQRMNLQRIRKSVIDDICKEFCEYGARH